MDKQQRIHLLGHLNIALACVIWGLMAPLGKDAMRPDGPYLTGIDMVTFRVCGAALCFWITSLCMHKTRHEHVAPRDLLLFLGAGLFGIVLNQCNFTIGLSLTSPIHASIMTTTMPIIAMIIATVFMHEPLTWKKIVGIILGISGALILIMGSASSTSLKEGNLTGDLMVIGAQLSFAIYLNVFGRLIKRYSTITCMKWMMLWAALVITPFTFRHVAALPWSDISLTTWLETAFVVVGGTFIGYILMMYAQKVLRPTVVSMYNYVQPIIACIVSVCLGLGVFGPMQGIAVVLVFFGVWLVNQKKRSVR